MRHRLKNGLIGRLLFRLKPFWKDLAFYTGKTLFYELLQLGGSYSISAAIKWLLPDAPISTWALFVIILLLYKALFVVTDAWVDWTIIKILYAIEYHFNVQALSKFLEMRLSWHQQNNSGALVGKVHHGTDKTVDLLAGYLWEFVPTLIQALTNTIALAIFGWPMVVVSYGLLIVFMYLTVKAYRARQALREARHDLYEIEWARFVEAVQGIPEIISTNQGQRTLDQYKQMYAQIQQLGLQEAKLGIFTYNTSRNALVSLGDIPIIIFLIYQTAHGRVSIADLFFVWTVVQRLFHAFWRFARLFDRTGESAEGFLRYDNLMKQTQTPIFHGQQPLPLTTPIGISLKDVSFAYNGAGATIDHLTLDIPAGQTLGLVGLSGSGKSTLAKILSGLVPITSGQILINSHDLYSFPETQIHQTIAPVSQADNIFIFDDTIRGNLLRTNPEANEEEVIAATTIANFHEEILGFPNGYDTVVGEKGIHLSGGQKQRLAIARAILRDPPVLILDEPTSGLDLQNETKVKAAIHKSSADRTTIIIAHRLVTIRDADWIVVMDEGRIVEQGTHQQLLELDSVYAHLHQLDQQFLLNSQS